MLQAAFETIGEVTVSDLEDQLPRPSYTVRTLQYLTNTYPQIDFMLCLGEDSARDFKTWKDWRQIIGYANLLVARRPSEKSFNIEPELAGNIFFADHQPVDISSTEVRKKVAVGEDISALVPKEVSRIIKEENLYKAT
jgi:nicotinate-nucleotide adenylyltransferase